MWEEIKTIIKEEYGVEDITPETELKKGLGLSSFDLMNLICIIEERYGIELDEERYRELHTAGEMLAYVEELQKQKQNR